MLWETGIAEAMATQWTAAANARDEMQRSCHFNCAGSTARSGGNRANVSSRAFSGRASRAENVAGEIRRR
jgi:hypothetical protein